MNYVKKNMLHSEILEAYQQSSWTHSCFSSWRLCHQNNILLNFKCEQCGKGSIHSEILDEHIEYFTRFQVWIMQKMLYWLKEFSKTILTKCMNTLKILLHWKIRQIWCLNVKITLILPLISQNIAPLVIDVPCILYLKGKYAIDASYN